MLVLLVLVLQYCTVFSATVTSGTQFISYHIYTDPTSSACYPNDNQAKWAGYITANTFSLPCGTCVEMVAGSKKIYVYAIDIGGRGFDLNLPAFCELCGEEGGFAAGGCNVNWRVVDGSVCAAWIAGKTKPKCNLCPAGSTCGNPDPNRNGGVDWASYCPGIINLGSGVTMTRCEMRIDGCTCTGGQPVTPPTTPPVTPPKTPTTPPVTPPVAPAPGGKGSTKIRCGSSWTAANSGCYSDCTADSDCTGGQTCWADLDLTPCGTAPVTPPKTPPVTPPVTPTKPPTTPPTTPPVAPPTAPKGKTAIRCGSNWGAANTACGTDCTNDGHCPSGQFCWADLAMGPCSGSALVADDSSMTETGDSKSIIIGVSVGVGLLLLVVVVIAILMVKRRRMEEIV
jgi:hypothetical protein